MDKLTEAFEESGKWKRSGYGKKDLNEFVGELMAEIRNTPKSKCAKCLLDILIKDDFVTIYNEAKRELSEEKREQNG